MLILYMQLKIKLKDISILYVSALPQYVFRHIFLFQYTNIPEVCFNGQLSLSLIVAIPNPKKVSFELK